MAGRIVQALGSASFAALIAMAGSAQGQAFREDWNAAGSSWFTFAADGGAKAASGTNIAGLGGNATGDGKGLQMLLPAGAGAGTGAGPEITSKSLYRFGTFRGRFKTADCTGQPDAGVVTGFFTYFNDGTDSTGDGVADNSEVDFEWLCAEPNIVFMTLWTDDGGTTHRRVDRTLNLSAGKILSTNYYEVFGKGTALTGAENQPATVAAMPGYNSSSAFYEYGFYWDATRVTWWIMDPADGSKRVLWDYQGPAKRIPVRASKFVFNTWHVETWAPPDRSTAKLATTKPVSSYVDWVSYDPGAPASLRSSAPSGSAPRPGLFGVHPAQAFPGDAFFSADGRAFAAAGGRTALPILAIRAER